MKNLKMSRKLLLGFGIVVLLTAALGITAIFILRDVDSTYSSITDNELPGVSQLGEINTYIRGQRSNMRAMLVYLYQGNGPSMEASLKNLEADGTAIDKLFEEYPHNITTDEGAKKFEDAKAKYDAFATMRDEYIATAKTMDADASFAVLAKIATVQDEAQNAFTDLAEFRVTTATAASEAASSSVNVSTGIVIGVLVVAVIISVFLGVYLTRIISVPLGKMQAVLNQVGTTGSMDFSAETVQGIEMETKYKDELGTSLAAFHKMMLHFIHISEELGLMAQGDMSRTIETLSQQDTMGNALNNLIQNINVMFGEINSSSNEVSSASKQIADGAQTLAQGSTEQAAAVQELSSSIAEVAQAIKGASENANSAANLAEEIKSKAETGTAQMASMVEAVREINEASQNIGKIIAVIDNIAFQTNILALNASVEAARAGQHGKGFAVVAEEVRSLATKSAAAAKDSGALIENSIAKAELGAKIAAETSESLDQIVGGINESSRIVAEIATSSEDQATAITQINTGIDQVAQVVHHNSATAEESAAASEELSGQSTILQQLISRFRLRDQASSFAALPRDSGAHNDYELPPSGNGGQYGKY